MTIEKELKGLVHFDINNKTEVKVLNSIFLKFSNQDFYKNGNPKGKPFITNVYYFFDNERDYLKFMKIHSNCAQSISHVNLVIDEGLRYDKNFLLNNLNKI